MRAAVLTTGALLIVVTAGALLLSGTTPLWSDSSTPEAVQMPELVPGTQATYIASGEYRTLLGNAIVGNDSEVSAGTNITVHIRQAPLPDPDGRAEATTIVQVERDGEMLVATAGKKTRTVASFDPHHSPARTFDALGSLELPRIEDLSQNTPEAPASTESGFADTILLAGITVPTAPSPLADHVPSVDALAEVDAYSANLTIHAVPGSAGSDRIEIHHGDSLEAAYTVTSGCPLPSQVRYFGEGGEPTFHARRNTCSTGEAAPSTDPNQSRVWPEPGTATYERTFPGEGADLPLPYREALDFLLANPDTRIWTRENADWVLGCATLRRRVDDQAGLDDWSWRFDLVGTSSNLTGWITRATTGELAGQWMRDPNPPQIDPRSPCSRVIVPGPSPADLPGRQVADVGETLEVFRAVTDHGALREEARLDRIQFGPRVILYTLDRCSMHLDEEGGGLCSESVPMVVLDPEGHVDSVTLEEDWYGAPLDPLVELPQG